jgi:predicted enzyme related to lactoylglutathione lyase
MSRVIHFEIHAEQPERACKFYSSLFGWEITKWNGPIEYWIVRTGAAGTPGIDGGILRRQGAGPVEMQAVNAYVCTIDVANIEEMLKAIPAHGGTLAVPKMPIPGMGWLAYFKDTEGNIFGVMQADATAR